MLEDFFLLYFNETTKNNWTPDYFKITVLMERTGSVRYSNDNESITHDKFCSGVQNLEG